MIAQKAKMEVYIAAISERHTVVTNILESVRKERDLARSPSLACLCSFYASFSLREDYASIKSRAEGHAKFIENARLSSQEERKKWKSERKV